MQCNHCNHSLPDDSRFCQYCGKTVDTPAPTPAPVPAPAAQPSPAASTPTYTTPATKTVFCRQCGKPIDSDSKRCTECGKQYFRGIKPMTFLCIVMALAVLTLATLCIAQELHYNERIDELEKIIAFYETEQ